MNYLCQHFVIIDPRTTFDLETPIVAFIGLAPVKTHQRAYGQRSVEIRKVETLDSYRQVF